MATPTPVQHVKWAGPPNELINGIKLRLPNPTLANNLLILALAFPSTKTLSSIVDDAGNTWSTTPLVTVTDTGNSAKIGLYAVQGATAGVTVITVTFTATLQNFSASFSEWYNVALSSATDGSASQDINLTGAGQSVSSTSFNTTTAGDLIYHLGWCTDFGAGSPNGNSNGLTQITKQSGYTLLQTDVNQGFFVQYQIQGTAGATNPAATPTQTTFSSSWCSLTIAFKAAGVGTAPSIPQRIFGMMHVIFLGNSGTTPQNMPCQFPTTGNALCMTISDPPGSITMNGISGVASGAWQTLISSGADSQACYKQFSSPSDTEFLTVSMTDHTTHLYMQGCVYDMLNCGAFDTSVRNDTSTGFGPGNSTPTTSFTPGVPAGVAIMVSGVDTGPPDSLLSPAGAVFLSTWATGMGDLDGMDNGDLHGSFAFQSNATQIWQFHNTATTAGYAMTILSFGQLPSPTPPPPPLRKKARQGGLEMDLQLLEWF